MQLATPPPPPVTRSNRKRRRPKRTTSSNRPARRGVQPDEGGSARHERAPFSCPPSWERAMTRPACLLLLAAALTAGCSRTDNEPGPGGVTVSEARALDDAAAMLESRDGRSEEHTSELQSLMRIS